MFKKFYPRYTFDSIDDIKIQFLKENNFKAVILDIDNTLVSYTSSLPDERCKRFLKNLQDADIDYCFISNNNSQRVERFCEGMDKLYIPDARKPLIKNIKKAIKHMNVDKKNCVLIGDQVFTDVFCANRAGISSVMVKPIEAKETPFFGFKRAMEKIVLKNYNK